MTNRSQFSILSLSLWRLYIIFSFAASLMIFFSSMLLNSFESLSFFSSALVLISYLYYISGGETEGTEKTKTLFSAQIIMLIGMGYEQNISGPFFISTIPTIFGVSYYLLVGPKARERLSNYKKRAIFPFLVTLGAYLTGYGITKSTPLSTADFSFWIFLSWWAGSVCYFGGGIIKRKNRNFTLSMVKDESGFKSSSEVSTERMFFHDIINSTHGISLFLTNRVNSGNSVSAKECKRLDDEIKLIQAMIKDHFGMSHRSLDEIKNFVPLNSMKDRIIGYIRNYLPESEVDCKITFNGGPEASFENIISEDILIDYPAFYRILVNLVKNIKEEGSTIATFDIIVEGDKFILETKNRVFNLSVDEDNIVNNLKDMIVGKIGVDYKSKQLERGVGLESIMTICLARGGKFDFGLEGEYWVNKVELPVKRDGQMVDKTSQGKIKKAA